MTAALALNAPNSATFALISASELESWLKVGLVLTSIVCTIWVARAQTKNRRNR